MKSILLTTTAIVAFAGAAAADGHTGVGFAGEATLGFNDDDDLFIGDNNGFYWDLSLDVTATAALDNGVTASATFGLDIVDGNLGNADNGPNFVDVQAGDYVLKLESEMASLSFGDLDPVAEDNYGGVDGDTTAGFFDQDVHFDTVGFDAMLVGEVEVSGITAMLSYGVFLNDNNYGGLEKVDALQVYATGDFGMISAEVAYQGEVAGYTTDPVFAVSATATVAGAEITGAYIDDATESSLGLGVSYPVGPVTVGGYYSLNDVAEDSYGVSADYVDGPIAVNAFYDFEGGATDADTDDVAEFGLEGSYDTGLGLTVLAGYINTDDSGTETDVSYIAGTYDLGGGAELLVSYAIDDDDTSGDEVGDPEYQVGTTVEVTFSF
jgi:hypothetical protein